MMAKRWREIAVKSIAEQSYNQTFLPLIYADEH